MLHMRFTFGLAIDGREYQLEAAFIDLLIAYVTGIIPLLGLAGTFVGFDENRTSAESLIGPILALSYGSIPPILDLVSDGGGVLRCISRLRPSRPREGELSLIRFSVLTVSRKATVIIEVIERQYETSGL